MDIVSCTERNALNIRYHTQTVRPQYSLPTVNKSCTSVLSTTFNSKGTTALWFGNRMRRMSNNPKKEKMMGKTYREDGR